MALAIGPFREEEEEEAEKEEWEEEEEEEEEKKKKKKKKHEWFGHYLLGSPAMHLSYLGRVIG